VTGKYDPEKLHFLDKFLTLPPASPLHNLAAKDARNWDDIKAWAENLSSTLLSAENLSVH
jgi:menaquinone-dependent protoporphyrinogen IX oxidase